MLTGSRDLVVCALVPLSVEEQKQNSSLSPELDVILFFWQALFVVTNLDRLLLPKERNSQTRYSIPEHMIPSLWFFFLLELCDEGVT